MGDPTFTALDFTANEIYQAKSRADGNPAGVRWWCLREDLRKRYLAMAERQLYVWATNEQRVMGEMSAPFSTSGEGKS